MAPAEAESKAHDAFWQCGYDGLSERTGLHRFALQTEFGGKRGLLLKVLERYAEDIDAQILVPLRRGGLDALAGVFDALTTARARWSMR